MPDAALASDPAKRHSAALTDGPDRAGARAMLKAIGFTDEDLAKPIVGVGDDLDRDDAVQLQPAPPRRARQGRHPGRRRHARWSSTRSPISDGVTMGTEGMKTSLVSREVVADSIELVVRGHLFDGLVCLVGCDKTIPARAMALGRLDVPGSILYSGTIYPGVYKGQRNATVVTVYEAIGAYRAGKITLDELYEVENAACPGPGACGGQYTANTMSTVLEFIGLSPAGLNGIPAEDPAKDAAAHAAGELVMDLVRRDVRPSHIVTREALENGIAVGRRHRWLDQRRPAPAGHRPRVRHPARHRRVRGDRRPDAARRATCSPGGRYTALGHVRRGRRRARHARAAQAPGLLHGDAATVDGRTIAQIAAAATETPGQQVVVPIETPLKPTGGLAILHGSLAPDGCVVKLAGHERRQHRGPARVFDSEAACYDGGPRPADRRRRRRRHPLRGPGRRPGHAGDAAGHGRARRRGPGRFGRAADRRPVLAAGPTA